MIIQPESWNLRYAPQLLLIFVLVLATLMQEKKGWIRLYSMVFAGLFILNSNIAVVQNWRWVSENNAALIQELEPMRKTHVKVQAGWMKSFELKLKHFEITPVYKLDSNGVYNTIPGDAFSGWKIKKDLK
jgi:glucan phosphoethanolaminetransferase (alkaline phosphatase superfamily)